MDIKLEKKPWYIRYRYYLAGGVVSFSRPDRASCVSIPRACKWLK